MKSMYINKKSGITLIALVITIIILMILVGVTISMVFNGGILEKANMSAEQYSINQAKEELELAIANLQMEEIRRGDIFTKEDLTKLNSDVISVGSTESFPIQIIYGKYKFAINELFKATYIGEAEGTIVTYTTNPKGYTNAAEVHVLLNIENPRGIKEVVYPDDNDDRLQCNGRTEVVVDYKVSSNGTYIFKVISSDNKEITKEVVIDTIDRLAPQSFSITGESRRKGIKINGEAIDTPADGESICSGIDRYEYYVRKSGTNYEYTKYESNPITGLEEGTYTVYAVAYDMAGNSSVPTQTIEVEAQGVLEINYTWEELNQVAKVISDTNTITSDTNEVSVNCNGKEYILGVGDYTYINEKKVRILGFNHDKLVDTGAYGGNNEYAGISFEYMDSMTEIGINMNLKGTNEGGWGACNLRKYLNGELYNEIKDIVQIKQVEKAYCAVWNSAELSYSNDYLWLLSCAEIWNNGKVETGKGYAVGTEGTQYKFYKNINPIYNSSNGALLKPNPPYGGKKNWLRSTGSDSTHFCEFSDHCEELTAEYGSWVMPGFAI